jgi:hypothetical protein
MSGTSVTISDMQNFVENMDSSDMQISSNIGNVIELGGEELGDDFGASLLTNSRVSARPANSNTSNGSHSISALEPIGDIGINSLEPLEAISFDIPSGNNMSSMPEISINRDVDTTFGSSPFNNDQTASGPSISLSSPNRLNPEEERKKKSDLINKLNRLETKGYTLSKRFTMDNTLEEIQTEFDRLLDAKNLEASLRFQRQCLMGVVTGFEFLNSKFNPFDWQLDGWSESVHENVEDFDEVFEDLYDKYKGRGNMPPEAKLMMSLVGSGFMFHMSNSFFRQKFANMDANDVFKNNPQLAKQFAAAAAQQAGPGFGNFMGAAMNVPQMPQQMPQQMPPGPGAFYTSPNSMSGPPPPQMPQSMAASSPEPVQRREMRGPSGVDDILKTFQEVRSAELEHPLAMPVQSSPFNQQPVKQAISEINSIHSFREDQMSQVESVRTGTTAQRNGRGRRKATIPVGNTMTLNL